MKTKSLLLTLAPLLAGLAGNAQTNEPADDWKPATSNQQGKQYPMVNSEGRARFRLSAPQAQSVRVGLGGRGGTLLTKGNWAGTTAPLDEGFHYYTITIDGLEVPDPSTRYFYGTSRWGSAWRRDLYQFALLLFRD